MKKIKMNAAKLQLDKQMITSLAAVSGGGPRQPVTRGLGGCPSDSICNDACASMGCSVDFCPEPNEPVDGLSNLILCRDSVDFCIYTTPGITGC